MAIPDYKAIMLPFLKALSRGNELRYDEMTELLADHFNLSEDERRELLPSGRQVKFYNRVGWARTYLKKANLIETPERGLYKITERGLNVLKENPTEISQELLMQSEEFRDFVKVSAKKGHVVDRPGIEPVETPLETLENSYQQLKMELAQGVLENVKKCSPKFFEKLVIKLLIKMGYGGSEKDAGEAIGKSGDGGVDGIIKEDKLGLDAIYLQAKRWEGAVGRPVVQSFAGSLLGFNANKGVLITTSHFSNEAEQYVAQLGKKIVLIDGEMLAQLMIEYDVGVSTITSYKIKRIDSDYFTEEL